MLSWRTNTGTAVPFYSIKISLIFLVTNFNLALDFNLNLNVVILTPD